MSEKFNDNGAELSERERLLSDILDAGTDILDRKLGIYSADSDHILDPSHVYRRSLVPVETAYSGIAILGTYPEVAGNIALSFNYSHKNLALDILADGRVGKYIRQRFSTVASNSNWAFLPVSDEEIRQIRECIVWVQETAEPVSDDWDE